MAITLNKALKELGSMQRRAATSAKRQKKAALQAAQKFDEGIKAGCTIAGGAAAGAADGMIGGELFGLTASEVGSGIAAGLGLSGALGPMTSNYVKCAALGGLSYAAGRRAFELSSGMATLGGLFAPKEEGAVAGIDWAEPLGTSNALEDVSVAIADAAKSA